MPYARMGTLVSMMLLLGSCVTPGNTPVISSLTPTSGDSGAIVSVTGTDFGVKADVYFDGAEVAAQGLGSTLFFTVPYSAAPGAHEVTVKSGATSAPMTFTVDSTVSAPVPDVTGYEVGFHQLDTLQMLQIVLFGSGFDTNTRVMIGDTEVTESFVPGAAILPGFPANLRNQAIVAHFPIGDPGTPVAGQGLVASVRNVVTDQISDPQQVVIPERRALIELDRVTGVAWPPVAVNRSGVRTLRRIYTDGTVTMEGIILDPRRHQTIADEMNDNPFSLSEAVDFFNANENPNMAGGAFFDSWHVHVGLLPDLDPPVFGGQPVRIFGARLNTADREAVAIFANEINEHADGDEPLGTFEEVYLLILAHEIGHVFNLTHCEGDAISGIFGQPGTTLMNSTDELGDEWQLQFSTDSRLHLSIHPETEVKPGSGNLPFDSPDRLEGSCT